MSEVNKTLLDAMKKKPHEKSKIRNVIGVISGKGGVGKSLVTGLSTVAMNKKGYSTAILDADLTGPSIPKMFGIKEKASATEDAFLPVYSKDKTQIMSANLILENETDPVLWRGPVLGTVLNQFWQETIWTDVDYMFVDMPPGTSDVALTVFQSYPLDGIIIVTSPQDLVSMIVAKAVNMANKMNVPILGIVENMSYFECPDCHSKHEIFGESKLDEIAERENLKILAKLPINPDFAKAADLGKIEDLELDSLTYLVEELEEINKAKEEKHCCSNKEKDENHSCCADKDKDNHECCQNHEHGEGGCQNHEHGEGGCQNHEHGEGGCQNHEHGEGGCKNS